MATALETETTDLLIPANLNAIELFTGEAMDPLIAQIKAIVDRHVPDISTAKGRKDIASLAHKVASSKVVLDNLGKNLVAEWKEKAKKVDIVRKEMRDELDVLRDRAREPLTRWEQAEADRLRQEAADRQYDADWEEGHAMHDLFERERMVREREAEIARQEAARKAKEEDERLERERKARAEQLERERQEREARIAREAEARAKRQAEEAIAREKALREQAERDRIAAEARAKAEQEAAVLRAQQKAKADTERKERERLAAEKAEKDRLERLAANKRHRAKIEDDIVNDLQHIANAEGMQLDHGCIESIIMHINKGHIRHITIDY